MTYPLQSSLPQKKFLNVLQKKEGEFPPPIWIMRQAGRYLPEYRDIRKTVPDFLSMCYTPELAAEVTLQPIRRFGFDAAILFSDILVIPDALGLDVKFIENQGPVLDAITGSDDIKKLSLSNIESHLSPVFEAIRMIASELPEQVSLIGFAGSPWTIATYMVEGKTSKAFDKTRKMAYEEPELFAQIIEYIVQGTIQYLELQIQAGVEVIQLFDSWAGVLSEELFLQWVVEPTKRIVFSIKQKYPDIPIIGFPRGAGINYISYIKQTGITAVGTDYMLPLSWIKENLQTKLPVQGNLDPLLLASDKSAMQEQVLKILNTLGNAPFIFNLGHGVVPYTPIDHVECLVETVRSWKP